MRHCKAALRKLPPISKNGGAVIYGSAWWRDTIYLQARGSGRVHGLSVASSTGLHLVFLKESKE